MGAYGFIKKLRHSNFPGKKDNYLTLQNFYFMNGFTSLHFIFSKVFFLTVTSSQTVWTKKRYKKFVSAKLLVTYRSAKDNKTENMLKC